MRKEIKDLMAGKSLGFMAKVSEMLDVKAASEYEIEKMRVARTIVKEDSENLDEGDYVHPHDKQKPHSSYEVSLHKTHEGMRKHISGNGNPTHSVKIRAKTSSDAEKKAATHFKKNGVSGDGHYWHTKKLTDKNRPVKEEIESE
jgi:hypothetical protein